MENKNWFVHVEWVVVLVTLLGGFYLIDGKIERQGQRTDKLYEMYCDAVKESNDRWAEGQEKWLETQEKWLATQLEILDLKKGK